MSEGFGLEDDEFATRFGDPIRTSAESFARHMHFLFQALKEEKLVLMREQKAHRARVSAFEVRSSKTVPCPLSSFRASFSDFLSFFFATPAAQQEKGDFEALKKAFHESLDSPAPSNDRMFEIPLNMGQNFHATNWGPAFLGIKQILLASESCGV
jgi:hypothetical protein